ncbi:MAG: DUF3027 domain-containing protein [Nocardioides sp.]
MTATARAKADRKLLEAVEVARAALEDFVDPAEVGEHVGSDVEGDRLVTHCFECLHRGYQGWHWAVTITRASRQKTATVNEIVLVPGVEAIIAPTWVPYRERVQPGDLSPGDLLPVPDEDPRLVPTYSFGDDPLSPDERSQVREVAAELYLGRVRTLSLEGRDQAAERWYDGDGGPQSPLALVAPHRCTTCGFLMRLSGPLSEQFGVCANGDANSDGRVVSFDHGCGAHSEVQLAKRQLPQPLPDHVIDTLDEELETF